MLNQHLLIPRTNEVSKTHGFQSTPDSIKGSKLIPLPRKTHYKDPKRFTTIEELRGLFAEIAGQDGVSDIIITPDEPVAVKIKGVGLRAITYRILNINECNTIITLLTGSETSTITIKEGKALSGLAKVIEQDNKEAYVSTKLSLNEMKEKLAAEEAVGKFRYRYEITGCAAKSVESAFACIMRPLPAIPPSYEEIKLDLEFVKLFIVKDGICIIAGATGEGKSTTLAAIIRYILEGDTIIKGNIITHEDPIEYSYDKIPSAHSIVMQSSIGQGQHILSFNDANRSAMRRSPNLAVLGELRDAATITAAIEISLTGHPVFATTHANSVAAIFPRLISRFPTEEKKQATYDIISTTRLLVSQKLIRNTQGKLFAVREVLPFTPDLREFLLRISDNPDMVINAITGIMDNGWRGVKSYAAQGKEMLESGYIDKTVYSSLVDSGSEMSVEDRNELMSYIK